MNYYIITYRLKTDNRFSRRLWEDFSESRDSAITSLAEYCREHFFDGDLFPPQVLILKIDEYLSVFK